MFAGMLKRALCTPIGCYDRHFNISGVQRLKYNISRAPLLIDKQKIEGCVRGLPNNTRTEVVE